MAKVYVATGITVAFSVTTGFNAELLDVNHGGESADMEDVTHQASPNAWREFLAGLKDGGEVTLTLHFDPDDTVPATGGAEETVTITWPAGTTNKFSSLVIVSGKGPQASLGTKMVQDLTLKLTGAPNWSAT